MIGEQLKISSTINVKVKFMPLSESCIRDFDNPEDDEWCLYKEKPSKTFSKSIGNV